MGRIGILPRGCARPQRARRKSDTANLGGRLWRVDSTLATWPGERPTQCRVCARWAGCMLRPSRLEGFP